ncbi:cation transporter, partial [Methanoregula sp.]
MESFVGKSGGNTGAAVSKEKTVILSLFCDIALWLPEIIAVYLSGSVTLFADVMKCGNEILATIFALIILLRMKKGALFTYDYGMGKFETFTRSATGVVMLVSIIIIFFTAFNRIFVPEKLQFAGAAIAVPLMIISAVIDTY